jgi:Ribonuclease G/E
MPFVRTRITKTGETSTSLVESYRKDGKPRQRLLANLHGTSSTAEALGRLAAQRDRLRKELAELELDDADKFYEHVTISTLHGRAWTPEQRKEIDRLMRKRKRVQKLAAAIAAELAKIQKEGAIIKKHCSNSPEEIQAHATRWLKILHDMEYLELGQKFLLGKARAQRMMREKAYDRST